MFGILTGPSMICNSNHRFRPVAKSGLSRDLEGIVSECFTRIHSRLGPGMFDLLKSPADRPGLLAEGDCVAAAWNLGERTGRWTPLARAVRRLERNWMARAAGRAARRGAHHV